MTDRDRLIEIIDKFYENESIVGHVFYFTEEESEIFADYLLANGVIVQKQGKWKQTKEPLGWQDVDCVECSACHESWTLDEDFDFEFCKEFWKYCPNCGARMVKGA